MNELLVAAMRLAAGVDPVPAAVSLDACAALDLRVRGAVLASPVPVEAGAGTRSGSILSATQLHHFAGGDLSVIVEIELDDGRLRVSGQVTPPPGADAWVEVRTPHLAKARVPSESGGFAVTGIPPGWLSVACHRPEEPPVVTRWVLARP